GSAAPRLPRAWLAAGECPVPPPGRNRLAAMPLTGDYRAGSVSDRVQQAHIAAGGIVLSCFKPVQDNIAKLAIQKPDEQLLAFGAHLVIHDDGERGNDRTHGDSRPHGDLLRRYAAIVQEEG